MFIVESIAKIRRMHFIDGKGIKTIARELCISKNTVKKIIRSGETKFELSKYTKAKPVLDMYLDRLNELLMNFEYADAINLIDELLKKIIIEE